jgi:Mrp family chromosome partitioning ATPase
LISSGQLGEVIATAREQFDAVIIDTSPVLAVSDALWLSPLSDGVMVVAKARKTTIRALRSAIDAVTSTHAPILGIVVNAAKIPPDARYHGAYYGKEVASKRRRFPRLRKPW